MKYIAYKFRSSTSVCTEMRPQKTHSFPKRNFRPRLFVKSAEASLLTTMLRWWTDLTVPKHLPSCFGLHNKFDHLTRRMRRKLLMMRRSQRRRQFHEALHLFVRIGLLAVLHRSQHRFIPFHHFFTLLHFYITNCIYNCDYNLFSTYYFWDNKSSSLLSLFFSDSL